MSELAQDLQTPNGPAQAAATPVATKRAVIYLRVSTAEQAHGDGASEGYSIPAQREACTRKAHDLGASVVAEFVDRGESARSAARPDLQRMLAQLAEHKDVDFVIVHKVDRLARNRADDVAIQMGIEKAGARLDQRQRECGRHPFRQARAQHHGRPGRVLQRQPRGRDPQGLDPEGQHGRHARSGRRWATSTCATSQTVERFAPSRWTPTGHRSSAAPSSCTPPASTP